MAQYNRFMGEYDDNTNYEKGDVVTFDGVAWYRKMAGSGISPIARKKPYMVWSRLNQDLSTIFPLGGGSGGTGTGLPSDVGPYKQMATDGEGNWVPVDRLAWKETEKNVLWEGDFTTTATEWDNGETVYGSQMITVDKYGLFFDRNVWYDFEGTSYPLPENGSYYGNFHLLDSSVADDGTPVAVYFYTTGNITQLIFYTREPGDYHIKLYDKAETTHPIPAEYIPRIVITNNKDTGAYDCNVSWEGMWDALKNGLPIVYVITDGEDVAKVHTFIDSYADEDFTFRIYGYNFVDGNVTLIKTLIYSSDGTITEESGPV